MGSVEPANTAPADRPTYPQVSDPTLGRPRICAKGVGELVDGIKKKKSDLILLVLPRLGQAQRRKRRGLYCK